MSDTPETDAIADFYMLKAFSTDPNDRTVPIQFAARLERDLKRAERERDEAQKELSSIYAWIERNHPDGFIDSLTYLQNLERVADHWHDRFDIVERERDEDRKIAEKLRKERFEARRVLCELKKEGNT
jgi:hypothetical protein